MIRKVKIIKILKKIKLTQNKLKKSKLYNKKLLTFSLIKNFRSFVNIKIITYNNIYLYMTN